MQATCKSNCSVFMHEQQMKMANQFLKYHVEDVQDLRLFKEVNKIKWLYFLGWSITMIGQFDGIKVGVSLYLHCLLFHVYGYSWEKSLQAILDVVKIGRGQHTGWGWRCFPFINIQFWKWVNLLSLCKILWVVFDGFMYQKTAKQTGSFSNVPLEARTGKKYWKDLWRMPSH